MRILRSSTQNLKNKFNVGNFSSTFYNFTLKIETIWAKKVAKPISETWNPVRLLYMFGLFILRQKNSKNTQGKKEQF